MHLSRWSECDCLHSLACLPLYMFTVSIVCIVFSPFFSLLHMHTCHSVSHSVSFSHFHNFVLLSVFFFIQTFRNCSHMDFRFLERGITSWTMVEASVRAANFINHLNVTLMAHKMLMQIFIGVYNVLFALLAFGLFVFFFFFEK